MTAYKRVRFVLLVWTLALAPVFTPYLLTPAFAVPKEVPTTHAGAHAGHHATLLPTIGVASQVPGYRPRSNSKRNLTWSSMASSRSCELTDHKAGAVCFTG